MKRFSDIHSHGAPAPGRVVNLDPTEVTELPREGTFSVGIHPWNADKADAEALRRLELWAEAPQTVAIGETGLDSLIGPSLDVQTALLERHADLAEKTGKPLILHIVRRWPEIMALKKRLKPKAEWIVHGFRGSPELARQLAAAGFSLSLGERFNPAVPAAVSRFYTETDCSALSIEEIRTRIDAARQQKP